MGGESEERTELAEERTEMAEERSQLAEERSELAEQRTEWAKHRTLLANERNFSAWLRTGLSAIAGGLAVAEFLGGGEGGSPLARIVGIVLVVIGSGVCGLAIWRYGQVSDVLEKEGLPVTPKWVAGALVAGLLAVAVLVLLLILLR